MYYPVCSLLKTALITRSSLLSALGRFVTHRDEQSIRLILREGSPLPNFSKSSRASLNNIMLTIFKTSSRQASRNRAVTEERSYLLDASTIFFCLRTVPRLVSAARNLSKVNLQGGIFSVYQITVVAIAASTLTSVAFAECREPAPIFSLNGCGGSEQIVYGSPPPYTAGTKYTKYQGNHYGNQNYDTEGRPPYPPYYPYPDYAPSYTVVITGYDRPRKAKSRNRRHAPEENALSYNEHTIRRVTYGVKPAWRALPPLSNVKAFSAKASSPTRSATVTSSGQLMNIAPVLEISVPKIVEVAGQRVGIVSADAVNAIDASDTPKLTNVKRYAASDAAAAEALELSGRDTITNPNSLAEALPAIAGALAAVLVAWFLGLTSRKRYRPA